MNKLNYRQYIQNRKFFLSVIFSITLVLLSLVANFYAGSYATRQESNPVSDIILDNIPVVNVDDAFVYGPFIMWAFVAILCILEPKRIPFILKSIALFVVIRSIFVTLTHIGPFPDRVTVDYTSHFVKRFTFGGDLFFSAHTGLPFLMALVFWRHWRLRYIFLGCAVFFGVVVLISHLHYSIDVLSAFFITYSIYHLAKYFFKKDEQLFIHGLPAKIN